MAEDSNTGTEDWQVVSPSGRDSPALVDSNLSPRCAANQPSVPGPLQPITPLQTPEPTPSQPPLEGTQTQEQTSDTTGHPIFTPAEPLSARSSVSLTDNSATDTSSDYSTEEEYLSPMDGSAVLVPPLSTTGMWLQLRR